MINNDLFGFVVDECSGRKRCGTLQKEEAADPEPASSGSESSEM